METQLVLAFKNTMRSTIAVACGLIIASCEQSVPPTAEAPDAASGRAILGEHEYAKDFGTHMVHVNALTTDQLSPGVARAYNIERSKGRVLLNVFVAQRTDGQDKPVAADVKVLVRNLSNQLKNIDIITVEEETTIYYIGEVSVANAENLVFDIDVTPEGMTRPYLLSYRQQFFTE